MKKTVAVKVLRPDTPVTVRFWTMSSSVSSRVAVATVPPRALDSLELLQRRTRRGCGILKLQRCLECIQDDLDASIETLEHQDESTDTSMR